MDIYIYFIITIIFFFLLDYFSPKDFNHVFEIFALFIIIGFVGLRYNTGYDYLSYVNIYESGFIDDRMEPGFIGYLNILRFFGLSAQVMFFTFALATFLFLYLGIKKYTTHHAIALLIFILIPGLFLNTLSIIRQEFSMAVAFYAFYFLVNKKYTQYIFLMLIGTSFHYSCGIILFIHLLVFKYIHKLNTSYYFYIVVASLILAKLNVVNLLTTLIIGGKYASYIEGDPVSFIKLVVLNSLTVFIIFFSKSLIQKRDSNKYAIAFVVLSVFFLNVFSSLLILTRLAYYFKIFEIVIVAELIYLFAKRYRVFILLGFLSFYIFIFIGSLFNDISADGEGQPKMIPYKSIFSIN